MNLNKIWRLSRPKKRILSVAIDACFITLSFYLAFWARLGKSVSLYDEKYIFILGCTVLVTIYAFTRLGLYRAILRYLTFHALAVVSIGTAISAATFGLLAFYFDAFVPRSVPLIYGSFLCLLCGGSRLLVRVLLSEILNRGRKKVLIYGAGSAGRHLAQAMRSSDTHKVEAFIDEDIALRKSVIMGIVVEGVEAIPKLVSKYKISQILLAIPSATRAKRKEIINSLVHLQAEVLTVPDLKEIVEGKAKIDELKDVAIEDLLGRDPVEPKQELLESNIKGKVVLVTGAGGSIGSELCRQITLLTPRTLILFDVSEYGLYAIEREVRQIAIGSNVHIEIVPLIGSVQRINRLSVIFKSFQVDTVYHAAAYKHVPLVEYNVVEGVRNNIFGTYYAAKAAVEANIESFVLISTDKAVRPTNVMGATKRMAELALQALADDCKSGSCRTNFSMVRFGNVLGSSGSVIPLFKHQIAKGGPVTVTHPDIIRYFMTIPEAAQLVIQAGAMSRGGDVFVLDMGEPVKIVDLAVKLIKLSGLEVKSDDCPMGDIEIEFSGLRPGEKLFEELLIGGSVEGTSHPRIMTANEVSMSLMEFEAVLSELDEACHNFEHDVIRSLLISLPIDFEPRNGIEDLVWKKLDSQNSSSKRTNLSLIAKR
ncbi:polysaccharide biosynthesis protein [Enterovibrio norvegicus]|uniref:Nucleoside-diphosphate sugar epimerase n=1 Tax=Enterovibrio norvegicus TaxID=188144 RepID=A0A2N7L5N6_9GAMM|nr:nucleoside-diphosphate sugar epimerase/dehydratase [Enterovibrio norvegicus]PML80850.1 nucleoside-diphosphate sugar epimerase [Enterovibrio norvegicus]PMN67380.1 nucleoside-diphosphate sugar epimerase [Enterovibrio norvegicus]PMN88923.1 nucleoside-diphosphate sugar epimerase [Enterovibrio norvegicus]